jgi:hypothetical protein
VRLGWPREEEIGVGVTSTGAMHVHRHCTLQAASSLQGRRAHFTAGSGPFAHEPLAIRRLAPKLFAGFTIVAERDDGLVEVRRPLA